PQTNAIAYHPKGKYMASGGNDRQVKLWDPATGREIRPALSEHTDKIAALAFSSDGKYLASASWSEVIVWDSANFQKLRTFGRIVGKIWSVAFSPDGKRVAAASGYKGKGQIKIWDATLWKTEG